MYVNASLIRELRMVYQHLTAAFGGRTPMSRFAQKTQTSLRCTFCYLLKRRNQKDAIVVINGNGVCDEHAYYAKDERIINLLKIAARDVQG